MINSAIISPIFQTKKFNSVSDAKNLLVEGGPFFGSELEVFAKEIFNQYRQTNTSFVTNHHKKAGNGFTSAYRMKVAFTLLRLMIHNHLFIK